MFLSNQRVNLFTHSKVAQKLDHVAQYVLKQKCENVWGKFDSLGYPEYVTLFYTQQEVNFAVVFKDKKFKGLGCNEHRQ